MILRAHINPDTGALEPIERAECRTCGQQVLGERDASGLFRCFHCLEASRASQGSQERLFEPARAQMEGQGFWALDVEPLPRRVLP